MREVDQEAGQQWHRTKQACISWNSVLTPKGGSWRSRLASAWSSTASCTSHYSMHVSRGSYHQNRRRATTTTSFGAARGQESNVTRGNHSHDNKILPSVTTHDCHRAAQSIRSNRERADFGLHSSDTAPVVSSVHLCCESNRESSLDQCAHICEDAHLCVAR